MKEKLNKENKKKPEQEEMYKTFSLEEIFGAIKSFSSAKKGLTGERTPIVGEECLDEPQEEFAKELLRRAKKEWEKPIKNLAKNKEVNNKYRKFFLENFSNIYQTEPDVLINQIGINKISFKNEKIILVDSFFQEKIKFFVENGRIKVKVLSSVFKKNPSLEELKKRKNKPSTFFLDEDLPK